MKYYSLPLNLNNIDESEKDAVIDMSQLCFKCNKDKLKRSSFLFIRNTGIKMPISFEKCTLDDKEEFLLNYMFGDISVEIPALDSTWLRVLLSIAEPDGKYNYLESILSDEEIDIFCQEYGKDIAEVIQFIISIPICAINYFLTYDKIKTDITMDEFVSTDYNRINIFNFIKMIYHDEFLLLVKEYEGIGPMFFKSYFNEENKFIMHEFLEGLPFLNMLNLMINPNAEEVQKQFLEGLASIG